MDHALPGAAFLMAQLCGKAGRNSPYWPMVVTVRAHHGQLREMCIRDRGKEDQLEEVMKEVPRVRKDAGYPPLVTPRCV